MSKRNLFLTSSGLSDTMKRQFFDVIGKHPENVKILYIPTAGIETDGAREGFAVCFHELSSMGILYENILVYNLELILSKDYRRTYSSYITDSYMITRLLTFEELQTLMQWLLVAVTLLYCVVRWLEQGLIERLRRRLMVDLYTLESVLEVCMQQGI